MSISSVQPVAEFNSAALNNILQLQRAAVSGWVGSVASGELPSTVLTLGSASPAPALFNSGDLWQALLHANIFPSAATPNSATLQAENVVASVLGLGGNATGSSILNASGASWTLSPATAQAVTRLLQNGGAASSQALNDLLVAALGAGAANASDFASSGPAQVGTAGGAFDSILVSDVDLVAANLNGNSALASAIGQISELSSGSGAAISEVASAAPDITTNAGASVPSVIAQAATPGMAAESAIALAPKGNWATTVTADNTAAQPAAVGSASETDMSSAAPLVATNASTVGTDPALAAIATVAGNPAYAAIAATLYLSAAVIQAQALGASNAQPSADDIPRAVAGIMPPSAVKDI